MGPKSIATVVVAVFLLVAGMVFYSTLFYTVDATHYAVFQFPVSGTLDVKTQAGMYWRTGATVTEYKKRDLFRFEYSSNPAEDGSLQVRFNDGGHAKVGGNISWEMPTDPKQIIQLHQLFGSQERVDQQLVKNAIANAMYLTSPLMSSTESYAARRNDFLQMFADQVENGVYKMESKETKQPDPITGDMKTVKVTSIVVDPKTGEPVRSDASPMKWFGINILPPTINSMVYDPEVEKQIQQQRDNIMQIQTAQAEAKKAEQAAITAEKNGQAQAAMARWQQEVQKAQQVTLAGQQKEVAEIGAAREKNIAEIAAQREKDVAEIAANRDLAVQTLKAETAEKYKVEQTKMGEGDANRRAAVMAADGALSQKIEAYKEVQFKWADAYARRNVPQFVTGTTASGGADDINFMQLMGMKAAKDLVLDTSIGTTTGGRK